MKKFMRIALVFALAGATLVGCTKDYPGDISDLNKKVAEQQSAVTALQNAVSNAQTAADNALANAQNALKEAQAAAKAAADANNDEEVAALTAKVATIEGEIADLEAKVEALDGLEAKLNEVAEQLKKDVDAKVDAALEEIRAELEKAIAQVEGNFNVTAVGANATYAYAVWAPDADKTHKGYFAKLAEKFPELAEIKKDDEISMFGALPFIVNPSTVELDDNYTFALVDKNGEDTGIVLGNPTLGYDVKAGSNVWNVEVQSPAYNEQGKAAYGLFSDLALVVENADGVSAQTAFDYSVYAYKNASNTFELNTPKFEAVQYKDETLFDGNTIDLKDLGALDTKKDWRWWLVTANSAPLYEDYFIIESTDKADIEQYGLSFDGSKVTIENGPEAGAKTPAFIQLSITAIGVNGKVDSKPFVLKITPAAIAPNAELAAKEVTLGYKNGKYDVAVDYDMADFDFSDLELKEVFKALNGKSGSVKITDAENHESNIGGVIFYKADGKTGASTYSDAAIMRVTVDSKTTLPGTYTIRISDGSVFCGEGTLTVANPEACPIKLDEVLCDENGVLQIVGAVKEKFVEYDLNNALVVAVGYTSTNVTTKPTFNTFVDEGIEYSDDPSWIKDDKKTFRIPVQGGKWHPTIETEPAVKLLYTPRNFSVEFNWFGNTNNKGKFEFVAEAVSPIYDEAGKGDNITFSTKNAEGETVIHTTIYYAPDAEAKESSTTGSLASGITGGKYVAGNNKGAEFKIEAHDAVPGKVFKWITLDASKNFFDYSKPVTAQPAAIDHTNIPGGIDFVVGTNHKLIEMTLDQALAMNFITQAAYINLSADPEGYKLYLSKDGWDMLFTVWNTYWHQNFEYNGAKTAKGTLHSNDESGDTWEEVEAKINATNTTIQNLAKGSDQDKINKARYDYFVSVLGKVQFVTRLSSECCYSDKPSDPVPAYFAPKDEIAAMPYFTCDNEGEYTNLVTFEHEGTTNHVTSVTAKANAAGKKTVTIPLTANVKDTWGMTSKKTVEITVKVK